MRYETHLENTISQVGWEPSQSSVQPLAPDRTSQNPSPISECALQMLLGSLGLCPLLWRVAVKSLPVAGEQGSLCSLLFKQSTQKSWSSVFMSLGVSEINFPFCYLHVPSSWWNFLNGESSLHLEILVDVTKFPQAKEGQSSCSMSPYTLKFPMHLTVTEFYLHLRWTNEHNISSEIHSKLCSHAALILNWGLGTALAGALLHLCALLPLHCMDVGWSPCTISLLSAVLQAVLQKPYMCLLKIAACIIY